MSGCLQVRASRTSEVAAGDANSVCRSLVQSRARQQADGLQKIEHLRSLPIEAL